VGAQQFDHLAAVAGQAVEDLGGLAHAFDAGALQVEAAEAAVDQFVEFLQQVAVDLVEAGQVQQHQLAAVLRQGVEHLAGQRRRQEGEEHGLHAHVFVGDVFGQPLRRGPLQARHLRTDGVAVNIVEHAVGDVAAERQVERALEVAARGAVHAALLAVVVEEGLHRFLDGFDLDARQARHHLRHFQQFLARQAAQHGRGRLLADAQQDDRGLFDRRHRRRRRRRLVRVISQFGHFSASIV
jgi:hypothetical protein